MKKMIISFFILLSLGFSSVLALDLSIPPIDLEEPDLTDNRIYTFWEGVTTIDFQESVNTTELLNSKTLIETSISTNLSTNESLTPIDIDDIKTEDGSRLQSSSWNYKLNLLNTVMEQFKEFFAFSITYDSDLDLIKQKVINANTEISNFEKQLDSDWNGIVDFTSLPY